MVFRLVSRTPGAGWRTLQLCRLRLRPAKPHENGWPRRWVATVGGFPTVGLFQEPTVNANGALTVATHHHISDPWARLQELDKIDRAKGLRSPIRTVCIAS